MLTTNMLRRSFFLTETQIEQLERSSKVSGLTLSDVLRRIIDTHFARKPS